MGDILKEAIADAKAVRETALQNAKMALEEAFTPQLKSMLSAKLKEEDLEEDEFYEGEHEDDEEEVPAEEAEEEPEEGYYGEDDEMDDEEPEEGHHEGEHEEEEDMEEEGLDLEAIIRELEGEIEEELRNKIGLGESEDETTETVSEGEDDEDDEKVDEEIEIDETVLDEDEELDEEKEEVDEVDKSSGIGKGTGRGDTDKSSGIGGGENSLKEVQSELKEYKEAVHFLKDKLHEVNILNAKLLFTNKLFKEYALDNNQKLKVVETFDRAQTTREIKLVYSTLAEQFGDNGSIVTKKSISESASSVVASTKPSKESRKVITEETEVADRFRKLAGLIK